MSGAEVEHQAMEIRNLLARFGDPPPPSIGCPHCHELSTHNAAGHICPFPSPHPTVFVRTCVDILTVSSSQRSHVSLTLVCLRSWLCVHTLRVVTL